MLSLKMNTLWSSRGIASSIFDSECSNLVDHTIVSRHGLVSFVLNFELDAPFDRWVVATM